MMNLTKFLKGCTSIGELMNLPNIFVHTIYKEYAEMLKDQEKSKNHAAEQVEDEIEEAMGG